MAEADFLPAFKHSLLDLLWPAAGYGSYQGSLYGRMARDANRADEKAQTDFRLRQLLDYFGGDRLLYLFAETHAEMTVRAKRPPRTILGHLDLIEDRMFRERELASDDQKRALSSGPSVFAVLGPPAPLPASDAVSDPVTCHPSPVTCLPRRSVADIAAEVLNRDD